MAFSKTQIKREIERERRAQVKKRLKELRELIKAAQLARREAIKTVRVECRQARETLRNVCAARREDEKARGSDTIAKRRRAVTDEERAERQLRDADRRGAGKRRSTAKERASESDDEVRSNVEPWAVPVFDKVRRFIKGSPRRTRTEAFLEWMHDNPEEVHTVRNANLDRELAQYMAEQSRLESLNRRRGSLADIPF